MKLSIGENIKRLRLEQETTQEQLASYLQISTQAVSKWENNTTTPDIALLPAISEYFDVQIDELFKINMNGYRNKAQRLLAKYDRTGKKEDFEKAHTEYEKLMSTNKAEPMDMHDHAALYIIHAEKLNAKAEQLLNEAIAKGENIYSEHHLITLLARMGRHQESIDKYERLTKAEPENIKHWQHLTHAYYPIGRDSNVVTNPEKALETAKNALEKFPKDASLLSLCGAILRGEGEHAKALPYYTESMQIDPSIVDNYYATAHIYQSLNQYDKALEVWENLLNNYESLGFLEHITLIENEIAKLKGIAP